MTAPTASEIAWLARAAHAAGTPTDHELGVGMLMKIVGEVNARRMILELETMAAA